MTDDEAPDGMFSPDGWGVYHRWDEPVEDVHGYMFGPFPTYEIAKYIMESSGCKCETTLVPCMFPKGVIMMAGLDVADVRQAAEALGIKVPDLPEPKHPVVPDRIH